MEGLFIFIGVILLVIDVGLYLYAPFPNRYKWYYILPGGGIAAYFLLRKKDKDAKLI